MAAVRDAGQRPGLRAREAGGKRRGGGNRRAHAAWTVELAERTEWQTPRFSVWIARLETEHANIESAIAWCRANGEVEWIARITAASAWGWVQLREAARRRALVEETLAALADLGAGRLRAGLLYAAGLIAYDQYDLLAARVWLAESRTLWREIGDEWHAAWATLYLGYVLGLASLPDGPALLEESVGQFRVLGDAWGEAFADTRLGLVAHMAGQLDVAWRAHGRAAASFRAQDDRAGTRSALGYLANVALERGDAATAADLLVESIDQMRSVDQRRRPSMAGQLANFASLAAAIGQPERAARLVGASEAELRQQGGRALNPGDRWVKERHRAMIVARLGDTAFAREVTRGAAMGREAALAEARAAAVDAQGGGSRWPCGLTGREVEVLALLAVGRTNQKIAQRLVLSVRTVDRHVGNVYGKIQARNPAEATAFALAHGLNAPRD